MGVAGDTARGMALQLGDDARSRHHRRAARELWRLGALLDGGGLSDLPDAATDVDGEEGSRAARC